MKLYNEIKFGSLLLVASICYTTAFAQADYKTNESIRSQLINGTAPGLKFASLTPTSTKEEVINNRDLAKESSIRQIIKGTYPYMKFITTPAVFSASPLSQVKLSELASNQKSPVINTDEMLKVQLPSTQSESDKD